MALLDYRTKGVNTGVMPLTLVQIQATQPNSGRQRVWLIPFTGSQRELFAEVSHGRGSRPAPDLEATRV